MLLLWLYTFQQLICLIKKTAKLLRHPIYNRRFLSEKSFEILFAIALSPSLSEASCLLCLGITVLHHRVINFCDFSLTGVFFFVISFLIQFIIIFSCCNTGGEH
ncbi:unnamed protein product [Ilex paraguariensis]|uniref:Uncharacterized protein n=1 Tax=Ilex paraguariensis TaxID=185542 RepID=A0ABC8TBY9_9AQUA